MEKLLEKLGAVNDPYYPNDWRLKRVGDIFFLPDRDPVSDGDKWLLIGEITEALREKGYDVFSQQFERRLLIRNSQDISRGCEVEADTLLDCYIKAGEELL